MAKENKEEKLNELDNDFFTELIKGTEFVIAETGSVMHSRNKVTTPLYVINCIYGGGIPLGVISEISGPPGSGKSTFSYQCMGNYQREYPNGVPVIYDMETSMDNSRLESLGVDVSKVLRLPASSLEDAFASMFKMLNKIEKLSETYQDISSFQIYDSISSGGTNKQHASVEAGNSAFNAGSMMEAPRIIKQNLANVFPYLEKYPIYLGLLNQVFTQMSTYSSKLASGGGLGLKHLCHAHIAFGSPKDDYQNGFLVGSESMIKLEKSKLSPKFVDIPCYIDVTRGGRIDEVDSFVRYLINPNIDIIHAASWYKFNNLDFVFDKYPNLKDSVELNGIINKNYRKSDMYKLIHDNKDLLDFLQVSLIEFINNIYPAQEDVNGQYRDNLIKKCKYFNEMSFTDKVRDAMGLENS